MKDLINKLKQLEQLSLPNGATGAVWLDDVISVIESHYSVSVDSLITKDTNISNDELIAIIKEKWAVLYNNLELNKITSAAYSKRRRIYENMIFELEVYG